MSSYVFMKVLESAPERYDRGVALLSHGHIGAIYDRIAAMVAAPGRRILDIGCGTGGVSLACAACGAAVVGIDRSAGMLEVARSKAMETAAGGHVEWIELGAAEIEDRFSEATFDAVVSCLAFSELGDEEQAYVLRRVRTRIEPGGTLVIADEVLPDFAAAAWWHRVKRWPVAAVTYALTQTTTRPLRGLPARIAAAGFAQVHEERLPPGDFVLVSARRPEVLP